MVRRLAIAAALGACGHAAPPAGPPPGTTHATADAGVATADAGPVSLDRNLPELAKRSTALYQELGKALVDSGTDCAGATAKLETIATTYAEVIAANARVLHAGHERIKALKSALEAYQAELDLAAKQIADAPAMRACSQDAGFARVMDRLVGEPT